MNCYFYTYLTRQFCILLGICIGFGILPLEAEAKSKQEQRADFGKKIKELTDEINEIKSSFTNYDDESTWTAKEKALKKNILLLKFSLDQHKKILQADIDLGKAKKSFQCSWSNNLNLASKAKGSQSRLGYKGKSSEVVNKRIDRALSLPASGCGKDKKICYGQTACYGVYKKNPDQKKPDLKFDFYSYASCVVGKSEKCPGAKACIQQAGKINDVVKSAQGYGYFEGDDGKYRFKKSDANKGVH